MEPRRSERRSERRSAHTTAQTTRSWHAAELGGIASAVLGDSRIQTLLIWKLQLGEAQLGDPPGDFFLGEPLPMRGGDTDDSVLLHWPTPSRPHP